MKIDLINNLNGTLHRIVNLIKMINTIIVIQDGLNHIKMMDRMKFLITMIINKLNYMANGIIMDNQVIKDMVFTKGIWDIFFVIFAMSL